MGFYDINYARLIRQVLPVRLRTSVMQAWLQALIQPVKWLYDRFRSARNGNLYVMAHNGQVCYLEAVLNDTFDPVSRGIFIADGPFEDPVFVYLSAESKPVWLALGSELGSTAYDAPALLFTSAETYALGICFIINVPHLVATGSGYDEARLRALTDKYRLPGKSNYSIVTY